MRFHFILIMTLNICIELHTSMHVRKVLEYVPMLEIFAHVHVLQLCGHIIPQSETQVALNIRYGFFKETS